MATAIPRQRPPIAPTAGMGVPRTQPIQQSPQGPYSGSPNPGRSGSDPRGRVQNQGNYQQQRFESQVDPMLDTMAQNYGRGAAQGFQDYGNIMGRYGDVAKKFGDVGTGFSGIGEQFKQLGGPSGYGAFTQNGGYSPTDIAGMRSRGVSPIRAAYSNAGMEVQRQRSLQGGYSPNATATLAKMAREQGQAGSDAAGNVEAQLAQMKQQGKLAGLSGQAGAMQGQLGAQQGVAGAAGGAANAIQGQAGLYGATPGMASTFGNQIIAGTGQSGQFGLDLMRNDISSQQLPGQWDTTAGRINDVANMAYPFLDYFERRNQQGQNQNPGGKPPTAQPNLESPTSGQVIGYGPGGNTPPVKPGDLPPNSIFNSPNPPPYSGSQTPPISQTPSYRTGVGPTTPPPYQPGYSAVGTPVNQEKRRFF